MADREIPQDVLEAAEQGAQARGGTVASAEDADLSHLGLSGALDDENEAQAVEQYLSERVSEEETAEPEEEAVPRAGYTDESGKLLILKEFTPQQFASWFQAQNVGGAPYNAVGIHHTYRPTSQQYRGIATLRGVFDYYKNVRGWPFGVGPHLWLVDGSGPYRHGQPLVCVGTHPRHDGIGVAYRNHRWLHIEGLFDGDARRMSREMEDLFRFVIRIVCERRNIPIKFIQRGQDGPARPLGLMFHRDVDPQHPPKSCPGRTTTHDWFDASMQRVPPRPQKPDQDRPRPDQPPRPESGDISPDTTLLAKPRITQRQAQRFIQSRPHGEYTDDDVAKITGWYFETAQSVGLDPLIVIAQMVHETANLTSFWSQRPRRNPAGIGVTGEPGAGVSFPSWQAAVRAHVGRLLAYALPVGKENDAQRKLIREALQVRALPDNLRGRAQRLRGLTGTWATDPKYAEKVSRVADEIRKTRA